MSTTSFNCRCGELRGEIERTPDSFAHRVVCYCESCQAFADRLDASDVLDEAGGTEIVQLSPAHIRFTQGEENLAHLRVTEEGPCRWYARCCGTPLANTPPAAGFPFVGVLTSCLAHDADAPMRPLDMRIMGADAKGPIPDGAHAFEGFPLRVLFTLAPRVLAWRLRGDHRRSPFFDAEGAPAAARVDP